MLYFTLNEQGNEDLETILRFSVLSLKNIASFTTSQAPVEGVDEKVLEKFENCLVILFGKKMLG